jgi:predicted ester cyclase
VLEGLAVPQSVDSNKALIENFFEEVLNGRDLGKFDDYVSKDVVSHGLGADVDAYRKVLEDLQSFFRDERETRIEELIAEGDKVVARASSRLKGPTKAQTISFISIYRIEGSKIVEIWSHGDSFF